MSPVPSVPWTERERAEFKRRISTLEAGGGGSGGGPVAWTDVTGKPSTFPPSAHTQAASTITDFAEAVDDRVAGLLVAGANVTLTYNDAGNALTIAASGGGGGAADTFETVAKNLSAADATLNYSGGELTSVVYASGITKTLNYSGGDLTTVVLSGSTPGGIDLTKTLAYSGGELTGISYS